MKEHGGFKIGEEVEFKFTSNSSEKYWATKYIIVDFSLLRVQLDSKYRKYGPSNPFWVSIFHIRKPNIKVGR